MRGFRWLAPVLLGVLLLPEAGWGVRTDFWEIAGREAMIEGTPSEVTIGPLGKLELSPRLEAVGSINEFYVWSAVSDARGNVYVGTGDQGKVYRIDKDGEATLVFDSIELDILSLALDGEGNLYAGTSPDGIVFRIDREGNAESFFDSPHHYVWDLAFDDWGNLFAATGEQGIIYRVDSSGHAEEFYDSPETNVLSLEYDSQSDRLLVGGDGKGMVVSLDRKGTPRVLFDPPRAEVGALLLREDGVIFAAASGSEAGMGSSNANDEGRGAKEKALLYRIEPEGTVALLWRSDAEFIYCLAELEGGDLLVGTGSPGSLVRVTPHGEATELKRTSESQVLSFLQSDDAIFVTTGNQGQVYRLGPGRADEGSYESETKDMMNMVRWGNLRWWGEVRGGSSVTFSTRSGNTEVPDGTWSEWEEIERGSWGGKVVSPSSRYLQWKADFTGKGGESPEVKRVKIAYKEYNLPPRVLELTVAPIGREYFEGHADPRPEPLYQFLSNGTRVEFLPIETRGPDAEEADEVWARSVRTADWKASDPNGDALLYDVYYRSEEEDGWVLFEEDVELSFYSWDTQSMPDGLYRIRVVARDHGSNPEPSALEGERVSDPFQVDNTPPRVLRVEASREGDRLRARAEAQDATSPLRSAEYSFDSEDWRRIDPVDEIFDTPKEEFEFTVEAAGEKAKVLMFRVTDQAGNAAVSKAVVR